MTPKGQANLIRYAKQLAKPLQSHYAMLGEDVSDAQYQAARSASDQAASMIRYLVLNLADREQAQIVAAYSGCPAYMRERGGK